MKLKKKSKIKYKIVAVHIKTDFHCGACVSEAALVQIFKDLCKNVELYLILCISTRPARQNV
jgi:hypothetical protein